MAVRAGRLAKDEVVLTEKLRQQVAEYYRTAPGFVILLEPSAVFGRYTVLRRGG